MFRTIQNGATVQLAKLKSQEVQISHWIFQQSIANESQFQNGWIYHETDQVAQKDHNFIAGRRKCAKHNSFGSPVGFRSSSFSTESPAVATTAKAKIGGDLRLKARMAKLGFAVVFSSDQGDFVHARQMATGGVDSANTSCHMFWRAFDFKLIEVL